MAGRINKRFVIILSIAGAVLVSAACGVVVAYKYVTGKKNPMANVAKGDAFAAQGDFAEAAKYYGMAMHDRQGDVPLMIKYVEVSSQIKTGDLRNVGKRIQEQIKALETAINLQPDNQQAINALMQLYYAVGRETGDLDIWSTMHERTRQLLLNNPNLIIARKYRGIAQTNRMAFLDVSEEDRRLAFEDLSAAMQESPDDPDLIFFMAQWNLIQAQLFSRPGSFSEEKDKVDLLRDEAERLTRESARKHPDDARRQIDYLAVLLTLNRRQEAMPLIDELEKTLAARPEPVRSVATVANLLPVLDAEPVPASAEQPVATTRGTLRTQALLEKAIQAKPNDLILKSLLAENLTRQRKVPQALALYKEIKEMKISAPPLEALQSGSRQTQAKLQYADLLLTQADTLTDPKARDEQLAQVESEIRRIAAESGGDSAPVNLLSGKLAVARREWVTATGKLSAANQSMQDSNPEGLLLEARAWAEQNQLGSAASRLEKLVKIRPDFTPGRLELARLYMQNRKPEDAQRQLDAALEADPNNLQGLMLRAALLAQQLKFDEAINAYKNLKPQEHPELNMPLAAVMLADKRFDEARPIVETMLADDPKNLRVVELALRSSTTREQALGYLDIAEKGGADSGAIQLLRSQINNENPVDVVKKLLDEEKDPVTRHMGLYRVYRQMGRETEALAELAAATKINADHAAVLEANFGEAVNRRDWTQAELLASKASALNLDKAEGRFYFGQLELARGQPERAVTSFNQGLKIRQFADGWRMLGDAQRIAKDLSAAQASYMRAVDQQPDNVQALIGLVSVLDAVGERGAALEHLRRAMTFSGGRNPQLFAQYLMYEQQYGDVNKALAIRQEQARINPKDADNRRNLAVLLAKLGRTDDARTTLEALVADEGLNRPNALAAAQIKAAAGDSEGAVQSMRDYVTGLGDKAVAEDHILLARLLISLGKGDQAREVYDRAIALESEGNRPASRELADLLFENNRPADAVKLYQKILADNPEDQGVSLRLVEAHLRAGQIEETDKALAAAVKKFGQDVQTMQLSALLWRQRNDTPRALEAINKALELDPNRALLYLQRAEIRLLSDEQDTSAMNDLNKALELNPDFLAARGMLVNLHIRRGESREGIVQLEEMVRRHPGFRPGWGELAQMYGKTNNRVALRQHLDKWRQQFPDDPTPSQLLARLNVADENTDEVIKNLSDAYARSPSTQTLADLTDTMLRYKKAADANALLQKEDKLVQQHPVLLALAARAAAQLRGPEAARPMFVAALDRCTDLGLVLSVAMQMREALGADGALATMQPAAQGAKAGWIMLAMAQIETEAGRYDAALSRLASADLLVTTGTIDRVFYDRLLATGSHQTGRHKEARSAYERLLAAQPNDPQTLNNLAYLLVENLGAPADGLKLAERAAELVPNDGQVLDTLGWAQFKSGQVETSVVTLNKSFELQRLPTTALHLAQALKANGQKNPALEMLETARRLAEQANDQETLAQAKRLSTEW